MATDDITENWQSDKHALQSNAYMFDHSLATDITFVVSNTHNRTGNEKKDQIKEKCRTIATHKYILVSRSTVFWTMFYGEFPETKSEIIVDDVDPDAFYKVLRFLYTDEIEMDPELVMFIWYIAKKYMINTLSSKCAEFISNQLCPENAATILDQSLFFDEKDLAEKCKRMLRRSSTQALQSKSFPEIRQSTLNLILDDECVNAPEIQIFQAGQAWAKRKCEIECIDVCGPNMRRTLGESLNKIRFPLIGIDNFNSTVAQSEILPPIDELNLFRYIAAGSSKQKQDLPYIFEERHQRSKPTNLFRNIDDGDRTEIQQQFNFALEIESESVLNIQGLYICDLNIPGGNQQQTNRLAIGVMVDGRQVIQSVTNKEDVSENNRVKIVRLNVQLTGKPQTVSVQYDATASAKCGNCSFQLNTHITKKYYCTKCGSRVYVTPGAIKPVALSVWNKSEVCLTDDFVSVKVKNPTSSQIPIVGLIYTI